MTNQEILARIDHTLLKPVATWEDIETLCTEAIRYHTASVCIPPAYVEPAHRRFPLLRICTVIGFPLGYSTTVTKSREAAEAIGLGAAEVDMVVNIGAVKGHDYGLVERELAALRKATEGAVLKVIIETCYLTEEEKVALCRLVTETRCDYIKTSTGFGTAGAVLSDVALFAKHIGPGVLIKAAGGVKTREDLAAFIEAGASRIGTSSAVALLSGNPAGED
jgi:deoxyribose-phosphate aldolase